MTVFILSQKACHRVKPCRHVNEERVQRRQKTQVARQSGYLLDSAPSCVAHRCPNTQTNTADGDSFQNSSAPDLSGSAGAANKCQYDLFNYGSKMTAGRGENFIFATAANSISGVSLKLSGRGEAARGISSRLACRDISDLIFAF